MAAERQEHNQGIICPRCECRHVPVYYTRSRPGCITRVRFCRNCGRRIVTREKTVQPDTQENRR